MKYAAGVLLFIKDSDGTEKYFDFAVSSKRAQTGVICISAVAAASAGVHEAAFMRSSRFTTVFKFAFTTRSFMFIQNINSISFLRTVCVSSPSGNILRWGGG